MNQTITIILLIILFIIVIYQIYIILRINNPKEKIINKLSTDEFNKSAPIINPSDYIVINENTIENKYNHSEKMLKIIGIKDDLLNKLINIRTKINKNLVYGIKNKEGKYRIEIYLYSKNITELNYIDVNQSVFKNDLNIILNEFDKSFNDNIEKIFNENEILLISFDLNLEDSSFNNKLHLYVKNPDKK